jgi:hypothetical protein
MVTSFRSKKVIYIGYAPLTSKTAKDFFIEDLVKSGVRVEYWDLSQYYFKGLKIYGAVNYPWIKSIDNLKELKKLLSDKENKNADYFINFPYTGKVIKLFWILTKEKVSISIIGRGLLPVPGATIRDSLKKFFTPGMLKKAINYFFNRIALVLKKMGFVKTFDRIYIAGHDAIKVAGIGYEMDQRSSRLIPINSSDYDGFLLVKEAGNIIKYPYVVFLDEYLPYHSDVSMFGLKTVIASEYYPLLNDFFNAIEKEFNIKVVIAAHPKAELYNENNFFSGRDVFFNKTAQLVKHAEFVLSHNSTSVSFAILFKKKLLLLYTNYMQEKMIYYIHGINHFSIALNLTKINISEPYTLHQDIFIYDEEKYNNYKYNYLTSVQTEGELSSDVFLKSLK